MALAIVGARLLDGRSETPLDGDALVVGDDVRSAAIGRGPSEVAPDANVFEAGGAALLPFIINEATKPGTSVQSGQGLPAPDAHPSAEEVPA